MTYLTQLAFAHGPAHDPIDDMRTYLHYMTKLRSRTLRTTPRGSYNRIQYVSLRLLERAGRLSAERAHTLARIRAIALA